MSGPIIVSCRPRMKQEVSKWPRSRRPNQIQDLELWEHECFVQHKESWLEYEVQLWILAQCPDLVRFRWDTRKLTTDNSGSQLRDLGELDLIRPSMSTIGGYRDPRRTGSQQGVRSVDAVHQAFDHLGIEAIGF